jgi:hypothetical protein
MYASGMIRTQMGCTLDQKMAALHGISPITVTSTKHTQFQQHQYENQPLDTVLNKKTIQLQLGLHVEEVSRQELLCLFFLV